jgi:ubiquinone/menaquinone biosynthesis C-methylase UbiE
MSLHYLKLQNEYDNDDAYFNMLNQWYTNGSYNRRIQPILKIVRKYMSNCNMIIDVGTAIGTFAIEIAKIKDAQIYAIDFSNKALNYAKKNAEIAGLKTRITFIKSAIENLRSIDDNSVDMIVCADVIEHLVDQNAAMKELLRVCKYGGVLILETCNPLFRGFKYFNKIYNFGKKLHLPESKNLFPLPPGNNFVEKYHISLKSYPEIIKLVEDTGFIVIEHRPFGWWCQLRGIDKLVQIISRFIRPLYKSALYYENTDLIIVAKKI